MGPLGLVAAALALVAVPLVLLGTLVNCLLSLALSEPGTSRTARATLYGRAAAAFAGLCPDHLAIRLVPWRWRPVVRTEGRIRRTLGVWTLFGRSNARHQAKRTAFFDRAFVEASAPTPLPCGSCCSASGTTRGRCAPGTRTTSR